MAAAAEGFDSYYATLSISSTATDAEIKRAYRKAAIASHPDKGGDAEKFKAVAEAFEVLSDANKRAAYDRFGKAGLRGGGVAQRTWVPGQSPEDIFRQMFGDQADLAALFREMQAAAARGDGIHWQQSPAPKPQRLSPTPAPTSRAALERLTSDLQAEFFAEDVTPPATAVSWREAEIRSYFERGGASGWAPLRPWTPNLEAIGRAAREAPMQYWIPPVDISNGSADSNGSDGSSSSMLSLLDDNDETSLRSLAAKLAADGAVALPLGLDEELLPVAYREAEGALGAMEPAVMPVAFNAAPTASSNNGHGSGSGGGMRGDAFVRLSRYAAKAPVLEGLREALTGIGAALTPLLADSSLGLKLQLTEKSDAFVTCVPTRSATRAHFDSACTAQGAKYERKLSLTVFLGRSAAEEEAAAAEDAAPEGVDGRELLYNDLSDEWRSLPPKAGTLLLCLSDRVLHKTAGPVKATPGRLSITVYFLGGYALSEAEAAEAEQAAAAAAASGGGEAQAPQQKYTVPPQQQHAVPKQWQQAPPPTTTTTQQSSGGGGADESDDDSDEEGAMDELG